MKTAALPKTVKRQCSYSGCETILSRFNPRSVCSVHERKVPPHTCSDGGDWTGSISPSAAKRNDVRRRERIERTAAPANCGEGGL